MAEIGNGVEEWKTVPDFPNYEVSNFGNVRSKDRVSERRGNDARLKGIPLKTSILKGGYRRVKLYSGSRNEHKQFGVHRLVAELFIPNPNNFPCVNHKDENPSNNHVDNLEWCAHKYNSNYGTAIQRMIAHQDMKAKSEIKSPAIIQCEMDGTPIKVWRSATECSRQTGINAAHILSCSLGKRKSIGGYTWKRF